MEITNLIFDCFKYLNDKTFFNIFKKRYPGVIFYPQETGVNFYLKENFPEQYKHIKFIINDNNSNVGFAIDDRDNKIAAFVCFYDEENKVSLSFMDILQPTENNRLQYTKDFEEYLNKNKKMPSFIKYSNMEKKK